MSNAILLKPSDNVAANATVTVQTGTPDASYPPSLLSDLNPAKTAKIGSTTAAWVFDFGAAQRIDLIALIHHDIAAGTSVVWQGETIDSWGGLPSFSTAITIPAWLGSGTRAWPVNPFKDLTSVVGYSPTGYRYWRLLVSGNSQNLALGQIVLSSTVRRLVRNHRWGFVPTRTALISEHRTAYGITTQYPRGTYQWDFDAQFIPTDADAATLVQHWHDAGGRERPFLFVPDPAVNESYFVRWKELSQGIRRTAPNYQELSASLEEVGRGLRPGV